MKVKILKAEKAGYWYADRIGEIVEVLEDRECTYGEANYVVKDDHSHLINVRDVVRIRTHFVLTNGRESRVLTSKKYKKALIEGLAKLDWWVEEEEDLDG